MRFWAAMDFPRRSDSETKLTAFTQLPDNTGYDNVALSDVNENDDFVIRMNGDYKNETCRCVGSPLRANGDANGKSYSKWLETGNTSYYTIIIIIIISFSIGTNNIPLSIMDNKGENWLSDKQYKPYRRLTDRIRRSCTKKMLYRRLPILSWLPMYTGKAAVSDLVAGVTVGLTVIPQAIAYANVAGLPPQVWFFKKFELRNFVIFFCLVWAVFVVYGVFYLCDFWEL